MENMMIFKTGSGISYQELFLLNMKTGTVKIYSQDTELGFPFTEYETTWQKMGYISAEHCRAEMIRRHGRGCILNTEKQIRSEVQGLLNLARYRRMHGCYRWLVLKDGTRSNDIVEQLLKYGFEKEEALEMIETAFTAA